MLTFGIFSVKMCGTHFPEVKNFPSGMLDNDFKK